eukprot:2994904-Pyramimonas_sp.AAC.1
MWSSPIQVTAHRHNSRHKSARVCHAQRTNHKRLSLECTDQVSPISSGGRWNILMCRQSDPVVVGIYCCVANVRSARCWNILTCRQRQKRSSLLEYYTDLSPIGSGCC